VKARTDIADITLAWLEDDDAVDEVFASAESLLALFAPQG
jgi:hypothetical protein